MKLRDYQLDLVDRVRAAYNDGRRAVVMQLPTGGGKTATASEVIRGAVAKGNRVVFAAHLDALLDDTSDRLSAAGISHGIVQADWPADPTAPVQVASTATLHSRGERPPADLLILDECHRAMATTVRAILKAYPQADILGLTATPQRGDGKPLRDVFECIVCGPPVHELVGRGYLVPSIVYSPPSPISGGLAMDPVEALERYAPGAPAMVFCSDAAQAATVSERIGPRARLILGDTPRDDRRDARKRLEGGENLALVGCGVFLEGWDSPRVSAVVLARAFGTVGAFLQGCGRALRPAPGKTFATLIDLAGAAVLHGLPEDERRWTIGGVCRVGRALKPLARCGACFAVFASGPTKCPRCYAVVRSAGRLKRRLTRIERVELARLDQRPLHVRDDMAISAIVARLRRRAKLATLPDFKLRALAANVFMRTNGRWPGESPNARHAGDAR